MDRLKHLYDLACDPATSGSLDEDDIHELVGGRSDVLGPWQVAWLVQHGMSVDSVVLDLGCGTLRGGMPIMAHLRRGHYTGVEPLAALLDLGRRLLVRHGLTGHEPRLHTLEEWDGVGVTRAFDYVLTQSVLNHLDADAIGTTIDRVRAALAPDGRWLTTVALSETVEGVAFGEPHPWRDGESWKAVMNPRWFTQQCHARGLTVAVMPDIEHPAALTTAVLRPR